LTVQPQALHCAALRDLLRFEKAPTRSSWTVPPPPLEARQNDWLPKKARGCEESLDADFTTDYGPDPFAPNRTKGTARVLENW